MSSLSRCEAQLLFQKGVSRSVTECSWEECGIEVDGGVLRANVSIWDRDGEPLRGVID